MKLVFILATWGCLVVAASVGQPQPKFRHYSVEDGLDFSLVKDIVQDADGFLWLNTGFSLARFDGHELRTYRHNSDDSLLKLGPSLVGKLLNDPTGGVWVSGFEASGGGAVVGNKLLLRYDASKDGFVAHKPEVRTPIRCLAVDPDSTLVWLGTNKGLYSFNLVSGKTQQFQHLGSVNSGSHELNGTIRELLFKGKHLQLFTNNGLWFFDTKARTFSRPLAGKNDSTLLLSGIVVGDSKRVFNLSRRAIVFVDSALAVLNAIQLPFAFNKVSHFTMDSQNMFWGSAKVSDNGLAECVFRYDPLQGSLDTMFIDKMPVMRLRVTLDHDQNVWFFGYNGAWRHLAPEILYSTIKTDIILGETYILKGEEKSSIINLGPDNKLNYLTFSNDRIETESFSFPKQDNRWSIFNYGWQGPNYFWVATWGRGVIGFPIDHQRAALKKEGIVFYDTIKGNPYSISEQFAWGGIYEDSHGNIWTGTYSAGLNRINRDIPYGREGSVDRFVHRPGDTTSICSNHIEVLIPGAHDELWIATPEGLDWFTDGKFVHLAKGYDVHSVFMASNQDVYVGTTRGTFRIKKSDNYKRFVRISSLIPLRHSTCEDELGRLWMVTGKGVILFDPKRELTIDFSDHEGLKGGGSIFRLPGKTLGFISPSNASVSIFDPTTFTISESPTQPMLTRILVNNKEPVVSGHPKSGDSFILPLGITNLKMLRLDYLHNNFTLEFSSMEMTAPEKNLYRYKLEGYDKEWVHTDAKRRSATYTNLPAGTYIFRVKASNHHGVWSDVEKTLKVKILPPPWRTWWAYTGYSLLAVGLLFWARKNIVKQERLQANLKLEHLELEKAKEVDKIKTSFFTNISHEFRTPLTLIKGPVDTMLERYKDDPEAVKRLKLVQRNSDLLLKLINQLLDLAKLEAGSLKVEKSAGEVHGFVRAVAGTFESHARQKGVTLKVEVPQEPAPVMFDKDKLETIIINLVNNAIKFTPSNGSVTVTAYVAASAERPEPGAQRLSIRVTDTGIGIPGDQQNKIFERFHQVSESHKEVGTGIGLALVKELVTLMGGMIKVESEPGKGSTFTVSLPVQEASIVEAEPAIDGVERTTDHRSPITDQPSTQRLVPSTNGTEDESSSKPHILVVEDNTDVRAFIIDSLGEDYSYLEAENGRQGLEKATSEIPDLIISDVMMPEMDGIEMAAKIKEDRNTSHIPLIILTAKSTEESKLSGLSSGADDYLTKPFNKQELLLKVRNSINRQNKLKEMLRSQLLTETPKEKVLSQDEQFLQKVKETIIQQMSDEQLSVESLADDIGMSRVQLYRKVSALTGMAVNELIRKLRLQRAAQLLSQNWGPVSQVAYEVGFSNLSYFSKVFKEEFGVLPSEYERAQN